MYVVLNIYNSMVIILIIEIIIIIKIERTILWRNNKKLRLFDFFFSFFGTLISTYTILYQWKKNGNPKSQKPKD